MKAYIINTFVLLMVLLFTSCDRSGIFEEFDKEIPWNFCVVAVMDENHVNVISGATVEIYLTKEDRDNSRNVYLSKITNDKGEALFSLADFDKMNNGPEEVKGIYYLKVFKGKMVKTDLTRYLLMNSGTTYQWLLLEPNI